MKKFILSLLSLLLFVVSPISVKANNSFDKTQSILKSDYSQGTLAVDFAKTIEVQSQGILPFFDVGLEDLSINYYATNQAKQITIKKNGYIAILHIDPGWYSLNVTKQ